MQYHIGELQADECNPVGKQNIICTVTSSIHTFILCASQDGVWCDLCRDGYVFQQYLYPHHIRTCTCNLLDLYFLLFICFSNFKLRTCRTLFNSRILWSPICRYRRTRHNDMRHLTAPENLMMKPFYSEEWLQNSLRYMDVIMYG